MARMTRSMSSSDAPGCFASIRSSASSTICLSLLNMALSLAAPGKTPPPLTSRFRAGGSDREFTACREYYTPV